MQQDKRYRSMVALDKRPAAIAICRALLLCFGVMIAEFCVASNDDWDGFLRRHVHAEGRVVDDAAGGISHSEGQGFGMFLAVHFDDRRNFDRMWQWTRRNLMVRGDGLLAWRWTPQDGVTDRNNATDGDIFAAWALIRAAARWKSTEYRNDGLSLMRTIREKLVRSTARGPALLPGMKGFERNGAQTLNLSYWVFPAFDEFSRNDNSPVWAELIQSGYRLLGESRFGRWGLPPDWLRTGERLALPDDREPRFGYDAVRIPLYLIWNGAGEDTVQPFRSFWAYFNGAVFLPSWVNLKDNSVDSYDTLKGMRAIAMATIAYPDLRGARIPDTDESQPYYSNVLLLLTKIMLWERAKN